MNVWIACASGRTGNLVDDVDTPVSQAVGNKVRQLVEETPASGKKRSLGAIAAVATPGSLLFGYDTAAAGAFFGGRLSDRYGRRQTGGIAALEVRHAGDTPIAGF